MQTAYVAALKAHGVTAAELGPHADIADTSLSLAVDPALVREKALAGPYPPGVSGNEVVADALARRLPKITPNTCRWP